MIDRLLGKFRITCIIDVPFMIQPIQTQHDKHVRDGAGSRWAPVFLRYKSSSMESRQMDKFTHYIPLLFHYICYFLKLEKPNVKISTLFCLFLLTYFVTHISKTKQCRYMYATNTTDLLLAVFLFWFVEAYVLGLASDCLETIPQEARCTHSVNHLPYYYLFQA